MKAIFKAALYLFILIIYMPSYAQQQDTVHWSYKAEKIGSKTYVLHITSTIDKGWQYAQQLKEAISVPTKIAFSKNSLWAIAGLTKKMGKKET